MLKVTKIKFSEDLAVEWDKWDLMNLIGIEPRHRLKRYEVPDKSVGDRLVRSQVQLHSPQV